MLPQPVRAVLPLACSWALITASCSAPPGPTPTPQPPPTPTPVVMYVCSQGGTVPLRLDASCLSAAATVLPENSRLDVLRLDGDCAAVRTADGAQGYISTREMCPAPSGLDWSMARQYLGQNRTVCGTVVGASYGPDVRGQPLWLYVGEDKPSPNRFQVVIRGMYEGHPATPPENDFLGRRLCVSGAISLDGDVVQMDIIDLWAIIVE